MHEQLIEQNFELKGRLTLTEEIRQKIKKNIQNIEPQEIEPLKKKNEIKPYIS